MILANVAAAETLEENRQRLIYRAHDEPSREKLNALSEFLATIGIKLAKGQVRAVQFQRHSRAGAGMEHENLVNEIVLRTQAQAEYAPENYGHFGLHLRRYAHFTSPIRRYADLIVHRALIARARTRPRRPAGDERRATRRDRRAHFRRRAPRHGRRARNRRPADRAIFRRSDRRALSRRASPASRAPGCSSSSPKPAPTASFRPRRWARIISAYDEAAHSLTSKRSGESYRLADVDRGAAGRGGAHRRRAAVRDRGDGGRRPTGADRTREREPAPRGPKRPRLAR